MACLFAGAACGGRTWLRGKWNVLFQTALQLPVMVWFYGLEPEPGTRYQIPWVRTAEVTIHEPFITVNNVRDFQYRTVDDYLARYRQETYDLREMRSLHLAVSHWDGLEKIAHTMLSFSFSGGKRVVLSVETRVPEGKTQNSLAGLFKQYGLGMVWGTERDLLQLRTKFRRETLYFYPTTASPGEAAALFRALMQATADRAAKPVFYHTLIRNCTTVLAEPVLPLLLGGRIDFRLLFNGFVDELLEDAGFLQLMGEGLSASKNRYRIPEFLPGGDEEYSEHIHRLVD